MSMTSRQRLLTALRCQQPDRVPIIIRGVNPYARAMNWRGEAHPSYRPLIERVRACCDVEHIWTPTSGFFLNAAVDVQTRVEDKDGWRITHALVDTPRGRLTSTSRAGIDSYSHAVTKHWICDEQDVERFLSLPFALAQPDLCANVDANAELSDSGYVLPNMPDPILFVHELIGSELLAVWSVDAPHLIRRLLDEMGECCLAFTKLLLAGGVRDVLGLNGPEVATPPFFSPRRFDEMVARYDERLIELAHRHNCVVVVHCHGPMDAVLERFANMGVDALHPLEAPPMGDVTLADAKRRVGDRICLMGNIQIGDLMACERAEIVAMTRQAICDGAPGGGFILTLSATPFERVLSPRTLDNLLAMIETGLECGGFD